MPKYLASFCCMPPYVHAEVAVDFLNAGSHIVVEKPMAASLKECDDMIEAARNNGKVLSVRAESIQKSDYEAETSAG